MLQVNRVLRGENRTASKEAMSQLVYRVGQGVRKVLPREGGVILFLLLMEVLQGMTLWWNVFDGSRAV